MENFIPNPGTNPAVQLSEETLAQQALQRQRSAEVCFVLEHKDDPFIVRNLKDFAPKKHRDLFGNFWSEGELALLFGDVGSGKSLLALQLAAAIAEGTPYLGYTNQCGPKKVLYIDFEHDESEAVARLNGNVPDNLVWAGLNRLENYYGDKDMHWITRWINLELVGTRAEVLIIDQPERFRMSNAEWHYLMSRLLRFKAEKKISILLVTAGKARHTGRPITVSNIPKNDMIAGVVDAIFAIAKHQRMPAERYIKQLKKRNKPIYSYRVDIWNHYNYTFSYSNQDNEENCLPQTNTEKRYDKMRIAEKMRYEGMSYRQIADFMNLPLATVYSWVKCIPEEDISKERPNYEAYFEEEPDNLGREEQLVVGNEEREARDEEREVKKYDVSNNEKTLQQWEA